MVRRLHPTETALINLGSLLGEDYAQVREEYPRLSEVPFDSDRKLMSTEHFIDGRYVMVVKVRSMCFLSV